MMMMLLNYLSFFLITGSLMFVVFHPKISFPAYVDVIMFILAIGVTAMFINTLQGKDLYGYMQDAGILVRLGLGCLAVRFIYEYLKVQKHEND